jgi:uncharacterized protein YcbX
VRLASILVFPIKSCRGVALPEAVVERRGLRNDRRFMLVDATGRFVTQREAPSLALVDTALEGAALRVAAPGRPSVVVPATPDEGELDGPLRVTVWSSEVEAREVRALSELLTAHLGREIRCVYMPDSTARPVSPRHARPGDVVSFADGYPLLVASESSRADLEARAGVPLPMVRFRPNLAVTGAPAWDEDRWTRLRVGALVLRVTKPCGRCVVTTLDPETGAPSPGDAGKEPLRTLASFRRSEGEVMFGLNLVPELEDGAPALLRVGDPVACEPSPGTP